MVRSKSASTHHRPSKCLPPTIPTTVSQQRQGGDNVIRVTMGQSGEDGTSMKRARRYFTVALASIVAASMFVREGLLPDVFFDWDSEVRSAYVSWYISTVCPHATWKALAWSLDLDLESLDYSSVDASLMSKQEGRLNTYFPPVAVQLPVSDGGLTERTKHSIHGKKNVRGTWRMRIGLLV